MNSCKEMEKEECKKPECIWVDKKRKYCRSSKNKKKSIKLNLSNKERVWLQQDTCYYSLMENKKNAPYILFDYDDTLCEKFTSNLLDNVKHTLLQLEKTHNICVFTNQMGISKGKNTHQHLRELLDDFTKAVDNISINIFYATNDDNYRKPMTGMYQLFTILLKPKTVLYYCGDAGGRKNDFSIGDLYFANNCNLLFTTPEEIFNGAKPSTHLAEKQLEPIVEKKEVEEPMEEEEIATIPIPKPKVKRLPVSKKVEISEEEDGLKEPTEEEQKKRDAENKKKRRKILQEQKKKQY